MKKIKSLLKKIITYAKTHKIIAGIIITLIVGGIFLFRPKPAAPIPTEKVTMGTLTQSLSITGTIEASSQVNLTFPTSGKLVYLGFKEGDYINKWDAIASLDQEKLKATLRQAEQDFNAAKAAVEQIYDQTGRKTDLSFSQKVSQTALEAVQNKAYDAMRKAQTDIQESVLISPIDGILTRADAKSIGVNVTTATTFTVTDLSSLEFIMEVDEADISKIKIGQNVRVMLDAYSDKTLDLAINSIDFVTHTTSTGGNAYNVKASIEGTNPDYVYRVGMTGNAEIILSEKDDILSVPLSALFETNKIYIETKNKKYEKRTLTLGVQNDIAVEVKEGLSEGEIIVTDPTTIPTKK